MKTNPLYFLRKYLPAVATAEKIIIMSVLNRVNRPIRRMYYIDFTDTINGEHIENGIALMAQNFSIPELNSDRWKYSLITEARYISRLAPNYKTSVNTPASIKKIIKSFDFEDPANPIYNDNFPPNSLFIDTICITDPVGQNPEIVYDRTGHLEVGQKYKQQAQKWIGKRQLAERLFDPQFLHQRGYFDLTGNPDLVYPDSEFQSLERLREEPYYPDTLFEFGSGRGAEIRYLKRILSLKQ